MIPIEDLRKLLPEDAHNMTDEELIKLREQFYDMGQLIFDDWLENRKRK